MDKATMVSVDVSRGSELVEILEREKIKLNVALWAVLSEYGDWRLVVSSRQFDLPDPRDAYGLLRDKLTAAGLASNRIPPIVILPTDDPFIRQLRRFLGKSKSVEGTRLGGQMFGDRFVEDAYVYRIS